MTIDKELLKYLFNKSLNALFFIVIIIIGIYMFSTAFYKCSKETKQSDEIVWRISK